MMKINASSLVIAVFFASLLIINCSSDPEISGPYIEGQITVDPELDPTLDYSGIELLIAFSGVDGTMQDTLFHSVTDSTGRFSGVAVIEERGVYPVIVSRNNYHAGMINLVLAKEDTIRINAQLPNLNETLVIQSVEHDAYERFERLQRNFNRVVHYVNNVGMSEDSVEAEIFKWSDLFWEFYNDSENTIAGEQSAISAISILEGWENDLMLARTDTLLNKTNKLPVELRSQLTYFYAETEGLDQAIHFLDQLNERLDRNQDKIQIQREKIVLLYDSSRSNQAEELLEEFKQEFSENEEAIQWAQNMSYDLASLAPGKSFPEFSFVDTDGEVVSSAAMENTPYLVEITRFENPLYQQQYDQVVAIHEIYGLDIITIPLNTSPIALQAFFDDRVKLWSVINPSSFDADELIETYNIQNVPTRFLIDENGTIIRRYVGAEMNQIFQGLQNILTQDQTES